MDSDLDIFKDLLKDTQASTSAGPDPVCDPGHRVVSELTGGRSLLVLGDILILLIQKKCDWWLLLFSIHRNGKDIDVRQQSKIYITGSSTLCGVSSDFKGDYMYFPDLYVIKPVDSPTHVQATNNKTVTVNSRLFTHLCGTESCLRGTPVCMITSNSGMLYGIPLSQGHPMMTLTVLMDIAEPVVAICSLVVKLKLIHGEHKLSVFNMTAGSFGDNSANCMLIVGKLGKVQLLLSAPLADKGPDTKIIRYTFSVSGLVQCADVCGSFLVHSTGQDVYITDMASLLYKLLQDPDDKDLHVPLHAQPQGVGNVKKIRVKQIENPSKGKCVYICIVCLDTTSKGWYSMMTFINVFAESLLTA